MGSNMGFRLVCKYCKGWIYISNVVISLICMYYQPKFHALVYGLILHVGIARFSLLCSVVITTTCKYWLIMYSINNHGLMKKGGIVGAHFYKFGLNSQITINSSSKSNNISLFKCGFNVDSQGETLGDKQSVNWDCINNTHVWVLRRWMRWWKNPSGLQHTNTCPNKMISIPHQ